MRILCEQKYPSKLSQGRVGWLHDSESVQREVEATEFSNSQPQFSSCPVITAFSNYRRCRLYWRHSFRECLTCTREIGLIGLVTRWSMYIRLVAYSTNDLSFSMLAVRPAPRASARARSGAERPGPHAVGGGMAIKVSEPL